MYTPSKPEALATATYTWLHLRILVGRAFLERSDRKIIDTLDEDNVINVLTKP